MGDRGSEAPLRRLAPALTRTLRGILGWPAWPIRRFVVEDASMLPALEPGDRVLAMRWPRAGWPRPHQVVVALDPERPGHLLVKRVAAVETDAGRAGTGREPLVHLRGDNLAASRDSRAFGPLPASVVVARVLWRYLPARRRGRL